MIIPPKLDVCPFCGSDDLHEYSPDGISIGQSAIRCNACSAVGPVKDQVGDWTRPHQAWNRRNRSEWKPISKLTEQDFDAAYMHHRLVVWNSCNGPHMVSSARDDYTAAWQMQDEGVWEKYLILPEVCA